MGASMGSHASVPLDFCKKKKIELKENNVADINTKGS
jgi:hypothetical protein